jgi:hypothetical protein
VVFFIFIFFIEVVFHFFLDCLNGTIFHQTYLTCDCSEAESQYGINNQIEAEREQIGSHQSTYQSTSQATYKSGAQVTYSPPDTLPRYNLGGVGMDWIGKVSRNRGNIHHNKSARPGTQQEKETIEENAGQTGRQV